MTHTISVTSYCASEMLNLWPINCSKVIKFAKIQKKQLFEPLECLVKIVSDLQVFLIWG